ncbi:DUF362 domain-containing protein [Cyanothece sp. BG0011]|uniref:DUF362 domain-containing protein n=1 Tax=Cyanothece sp. BG0011 TaxID=2082950 RepID=UPI000D1DCD51|nr:DUF362 domain-containing protein [Cyanothece sp. BG0011]
MSSVSLLSAHSYDLLLLKASLEELLEPLGGIKSFVKPGQRVLLKPNLLTGSRPTKECVTRPEMVYCVAQLVKEAGGTPFLGDSPAFGTARGVALANGYGSIMEELGLEVVEFQGKRYPHDSEHFDHLHLSKEAMEADVVINLPKVKSHVQLTLTLGVKNLFGCVPGKMKAWWHMEAGKDRDRFGEMLVETARAISKRSASRCAPNLTIIDGIIAHEGNGPSNGEPRELGILGASEDVFALDCAMIELLKVSPSSIPTWVAQQRLGLTSNVADIEFPLSHPTQLQVNDWQLPDKIMSIDFGLPRVIRSTFKHLYIRLVREPLKIS